MKSWKTTLGGALLALGQWASTQSEPWWLYKAGGLLSIGGALLLGGSARDNNVPSTAIPKAMEREEKILHPEAQP
jgi:hypothetical protein